METVTLLTLYFTGVTLLTVLVPWGIWCLIGWAWIQLDTWRDHEKAIRLSEIPTRKIMA